MLMREELVVNPSNGDTKCSIGNGRRPALNLTLNVEAKEFRSLPFS